MHAEGRPRIALCQDAHSSAQRDSWDNMFPLLNDLEFLGLYSSLSKFLVWHSKL